MNEQTTKLIEQLATKLGTTSEYLWGVLIRQSYISAISTIITDIIIILLGFVLWKVHKYFMKTQRLDSMRDYEKYGDSESTLTILMTVCVFVYSVLIVVMLCRISDIINGFFNPEYWALNHILESLK